MLRHGRQGSGDGPLCVLEVIGSITLVISMQQVNRTQRLKGKKWIQYGVRLVLPYYSRDKGLS